MSFKRKEVPFKSPEVPPHSRRIIIGQLTTSR
jgi:hypothetical protein